MLDYLVTCAVNSSSPSDRLGQPSPMFPFCLLVPPASFQLLHVSHPSTFSLNILSTSFHLRMPAFAGLHLHIIITLNYQVVHRQTKSYRHGEECFRSTTCYIQTNLTAFSKANW